MKKSVALLLMLVFMLSASIALAYPRVLTDQAGREVTIEKEPERIVSGYYISTSACIALGLEARMTAIEAKADTRPIYALAAPALIGLPSVGTAKSFDLEGCLAAEPDLVILPKRLAEAAEEISAFGIPVLLVNPESETLLYEMILTIGIATNTQERAEELIAFGVSQLALCSEMLAQTAPVSALMLGNSTYLSCAPGDMYQSGVLAGAGAVNAAAEMTGGTWAQLSYEQLLALNPQVLVIPAEAAYTAADVLADPELARLEAVKNGAVYAMPKGFEAWDSPVPSGVLGTLWLASELHPQAYAPAQYAEAAKTLYETYYGFTPDEAAL